MIKGAIFDFDGTLFDSMSVWENIGELYLCSKGYIPENDFSQILSTMSLHQAACYIKVKYGLGESTEEICVEINHMIENSYKNAILPKAGVKEFLQLLQEKGVHMCIATATDKYLIESALHRCDMDKYFESILTCSEFSTSKDEPLIFRKALKSIGTTQDETVIFEDAYHALQTAKKDGFTVVGIFDQYEKHKADVVNMSDVYLNDYSDAEKFWKFTSKI